MAILFQEILLSTKKKWQDTCSHLSENWKTYLALLIFSVFGSTSFIDFNQETIVYQIYKINDNFFYLEKSETPTDLEKGLMYRTSMNKQHGMLFVFPKPSYLAMWMQNTYIPLDIIYLDESYKIVQIYRYAVPLDTTLIPSKYATKYVVELNAGEADLYQIKEGDVLVKWR